MARVGRRITADPDDGEKYIYSGDLQEFMRDMVIAGDGGDAFVYAKTDRKGRVMSIWATATPTPAAVAAPPGPDGWAPSEFPANEFPMLPASPPADPASTDILTGPATARQVTVGARHRK
jgi:hypothetical protein